VLTSGGNLRARYVIHTVGPIYGSSGGRDAELLAACYRNCLALAVQHNLKTLAFPSISTGVFGYPREEAALVSSEAIREFLKSDDTIEQLYLVFYKREDADVFLHNQMLTDAHRE
jgi:O-acetyl-ADP-ribose deacetylase